MWWDISRLWELLRGVFSFTRRCDSTPFLLLLFCMLSCCTGYIFLYYLCSSGQRVTPTNTKKTPKASSWQSRACTSAYATSTRAHALFSRDLVCNSTPTSTWTLLCSKLRCVCHCLFSQQALFSCYVSRFVLLTQMWQLPSYQLLSHTRCI